MKSGIELISEEGLLLGKDHGLVLDWHLGGDFDNGWRVEVYHRHRNHSSDGFILSLAFLVCLLGCFSLSNLLFDQNFELLNFRLAYQIYRHPLDVGHVSGHISAHRCLVFNFEAVVCIESLIFRHTLDG